MTKIPKREPRIIDVTCRFCGTKTGEYDVPERFDGQEVTLESLGIMDSRCDACQATHGTVQEAERAIEAALFDVGGCTPEKKMEILEASGWSEPAVVEMAAAEREQRIEERKEAEKESADADAGLPKDGRKV